MVESKVKGEKIEVAPEAKPRGQVIDLMEALKKSLAGKVGQQHKKKVAPRRIEKGFSFSEFKTVMAELKVPEESLRQSYASLDKLRKKENLSWDEMRSKIETQSEQRIWFLRCWQCKHVFKVELLPSDLIITGRQTQSRSKELFLSVRIVSTYRARVLEKMNMKSNAELIRYALEKKLID